MNNSYIMMPLKPKKKPLLMWIALIAIFLIILFPIWSKNLKFYFFNTILGLIGLIIFILTVRMWSHWLFWLFEIDFWILPNLDNPVIFIYKGYERRSAVDTLLFNKIM